MILDKTVKTKRTTKGSLLRFAVVGFSNFVIISLTVWVMMDLLEQHYILSNICAYTLAIVSSFVLNKVWVFCSDSKNLGREILLYLSAFGCAYVAQFLFMWSLIEFAGMNEYLAQFLGLFIFGTVNFLMNKLLTFQH